MSSPSIANGHVNQTDATQHLEIGKSVTGFTGTVPNIFVFTVAADSPANAPLPNPVTATNVGSSVTFGTMTYDTPGDYYYTITETGYTTEATAAQRAEFSLNTSTTIYAKVHVNGPNTNNELIADAPVYYSDAGHTQTLSSPSIANTHSVSSVRVSKAFSGIDSLPTVFQITNDYNGDIFTIANATGTSPYTWTIEDVPVDTVITFTESGIQVDGYDLEVNGVATTTDTATVTATVTDGTVKTAELVNDYTQKTVEKTVHDTVDIYKEDKSTRDPLDGAEFTLYSSETCKDAEKIKTYSGKKFSINTEDADLASYLPEDPADTTTLYLKETKAPDGYVRDDTVHAVALTVDISEPEYDAEEDAFVITTTYSIQTDEKTSVNIPNKKTEVKVSKVDVADGKELEGATIQILDKDGKLVTEWTSGKEAHEVTGLKTGEEYTLKETVAPDGYCITAETHFTIDETGKITSKDTKINEEGVMLVEDAMTSIKVQKTDITDNEQELTGAHIQILDKEGNVVDVWVSEEGKPHEVKGLKTGEEYTLRETVAPEGYDITTDTSFTIDENGKVTSTGTVREDGVLLVEDAKLPRTSATVKKVWNDDNNRDGKRPDNLTIELLADGEKTGKSVTLNEANHWIGRIDDLIKCTAAEHKEIKYTWAEPEVEGYTLSNKSVNGTLTTLTNTYGPETTQINVKKVWVDDGKHPNGISVRLFADGQALGEAVTLNEGNGWAYSWSDLCRYDAGNEIRYTVAETETPEGYTAKITGSMSDGYVITNTKLTGKLVIRKEFDIQQPEIVPKEEEMKTEIQVVKIWDDNDNKDGNRPEKITIRLYAGGEEVKTAELSAKNGWKRTFGDLPKFVDGHPIHYSVKEDPVKWYVTEIRGFTITNRYQPEVTSAAVQKVWDDEGNDALRPLSIYMKLSNGMSIELNEKNGWTGVITNLPKYVNGKEAVYTWTEQRVLGYQIKSTVVEGNVTVITNEPYHNDGTPKGKKPASRGPGTEHLEDYDTPLGVNVIINHVGDCFD